MFVLMIYDGYASLLPPISIYHDSPELAFVWPTLPIIMPDLAVAVVTLKGSIISVFAAGPIFVCYLVLPPQKNFRHTLILNLATTGKLILSE